jgi:plasmid stability protein
MKNFTIKGIPDGLFERVRRNAAANRRSLNQEMIMSLDRGAGPLGFDPAEMLAQVRATRALFKGAPLTQEFIDAAIEEGRP